MVKRVIGLVLVVSCGGCAPVEDATVARHAAPITVAELFLFSRRVNPPRASAESAAGGAVFPAPCPPPAGRPHKKKGLFNARRRRRCQ